MAVVNYQDGVEFVVAATFTPIPFTASSNTIFITISIAKVMIVAGLHHRNKNVVPVIRTLKGVLNVSNNDAFFAGW